MLSSLLPLTTKRLDQKTHHLDNQAALERAAPKQRRMDAIYERVARRVGTPRQSNGGQMHAGNV